MFNLDEIATVLRERAVVADLVGAEFGPTSMRAFTGTHFRRLGYSSAESLLSALKHFAGPSRRQYGGSDRTTKRKAVTNLATSVEMSSNADIAATLRRLADEFECGTHGEPGNRETQG
jgi:hypothetical protein